MASRFANHMRQVYGVDFSGAADAGRRIWITRGVIDGGDCLRIEDCHRGADLPGSGMERDRCLAALRDFIVKERAGAFGLDFPFGLPRRLVEEASWLEFVLSFPKRHHSPEAFREACRAATGGAELKRVTDRETGTPFSPYNRQLRTGRGCSRSARLQRSSTSLSIGPTRARPENITRVASGSSRLLWKVPIYRFHHLWVP
jgi:hypothetical protein